MTLENALSFLAVVGIYLVLYHGLSSLFLESGRQKIFELRDHIFDYVHEHEGTITAAQHKEIRDFFNRTILAMEYTTILRIVIVSWFHKEKRPHSDLVSDLYSEIRDKKAREFIKSQLKRVVPIIIKTMLLRAPITLVILTSSAIVLMAIDFISPFQRGIRDRIKNSVKDKVIHNLDQSYVH